MNEIYCKGMIIYKCMKEQEVPKTEMCYFGRNAVI